jgi:VanZ family protein
VPASGPSTGAARYYLVAYIGLVLFASLYSAQSWRDQGIAPWAYLFQSWPRYFTTFDLTANVLGYVPIGCLAVLTFLPRRWLGAAFGIVLGLFLSAGIEAAQAYLPNRIPSKLDLLCNAAGLIAGVMTGLVASRRPADGFSWMRLDGAAVLVPGLVVLWLLGQVNLLTTPFAIGDLRTVLDLGWVATVSGGGAYIAWQALSCGVAVGTLGLLIRTATAARSTALVLLGATLLSAVAVRAVSAFVLTGGVAWTAVLTPGAALGGVFGCLVLLLRRESKTNRYQLLLLLICATLLVNFGPNNPYSDLSLQSEPGGQLENLLGLTRWLGAAWPLLLAAYLVSIRGVWSAAPSFN